MSNYHYQVKSRRVKRRDPPMQFKLKVLNICVLKLWILLCTALYKGISSFFPIKRDRYMIDKWHRQIHRMLNECILWKKIGEKQRVKEFHNAPLIKNTYSVKDNALEIPTYLVTSFISLLGRVGKYFIPNPFPTAPHSYELPDRLHNMHAEESTEI